MKSYELVNKLLLNDVNIEKHWRIRNMPYKIVCTQEGYKVVSGDHCYGSFETEEAAEKALATLKKSKDVDDVESTHTKLNWTGQDAITKRKRT